MYKKEWLLPIAAVLVIGALVGCGGGGGGSSSSGTPTGVEITSISPKTASANQAVVITLNGLFNEGTQDAYLVQFVQNGIVDNSFGNFTSQVVSTSKITVTFASNAVSPAGTYDIQVVEGGSTGNHSSALTSADQITFQ